MHQVIRTDDQKLAEDLRKLDDQVDELYSAIKVLHDEDFARGPGQARSRRWADIISFTINMEQIGDIIERVLIDIEDKKIKKGRQFSEAGMEEINELHTRLVANLRLAMSVFLNGNVRDAQKLLEEKPASAIWSAPIRPRTWRACQTTRCRALKPAHCTST